MPDLLTHLALGYVVSDLRGYDKAIFLLGSVLPDAKILSLLVAPFVADRTANALFYAFDAPVIVIPLALMFSVFFRSRRTAALHLSYAMLLHLSLDFLQYRFGGGIPLLYPFVEDRFSAGLFWQDNYYVTVVAVLAAVGVLVYRRMAKDKIPG